MKWPFLLASALAALTPFQPLDAAAPKALAAPEDRVRIVPQRIDATLAKMVADHRIAGGSVLIWKGGREVYFGKAGWADIERRRPIARSDLFQIWSMTKPVTGVGLMRLWEQGRFGLDEPLAKYLPEYRAAMVYAGEDAAGQPRFVAPERPILVRDILRHSAGFTYRDGPTYPERVNAAANPYKEDNDLAEFSRRFATVPLLYQPGHAWRYSAGVDIQARLIEVLSGQNFTDYMQAQVLGPLGMNETGWKQPESRYARLATTYTGDADGSLKPTSEADKRNLSFGDRRLFQGGTGIASTIDDYMRFARMLLNQGSLDGTRILKPHTVRLMSSDQLDPSITERDWLPGKGNGGFGFDFFVRTGRPLNAQENRGAVGEFFWDGGLSTLFWVDPANDMAVVFMVQKAPFDGTLHHDIREAVYGADYLGPPGN